MRAWARAAWTSALAAALLVAPLVASAQSDDPAPAFGTAQLDRDRAADGESFHLTVEVAAPSGIAHVSAHFRPEAGSKSWQLSGDVRFDPPSRNGTFAIRFSVPPGHLPGWYRLHSVIAYDADGRYRSMTMGDDVPRIAIGDLNATVDVTPPAFGSARLDRDRVQPGESFNLTIEAEDASGLTSLDAFFRPVNGSKHWGVSSHVGFEVPDRAGSYVLRFDVPHGHMPGWYALAGAYAYDSHRNFGEIPSGFPALRIGIGDLDARPDVDPPRVGAVRLDRARVDPGETFNVTVEVEDATGVASITAYFRAITDGRSRDLTGGRAFDPPSTNGSITLEVRVPTDVSPGWYPLFLVMATDGNRNVIPDYDMDPGVRIAVGDAGEAPPLPSPVDGPANVTATPEIPWGAPMPPPTTSVACPGRAADAPAKYGVRKPGVAIDSIVIHAFALHGSPGGFDAVVRDLQCGPSAASAHYAVSRTGEVRYIVDEARRAHHATYYNSRSIGIEVEGAADDATWWDWNASSTMYAALADLVRDLRARHPAIPLAHPTAVAAGWEASGSGRAALHGYASDYSVCAEDPTSTSPLLCGHHHTPLDAAGIVGHAQVQPRQKTDPGPHFDWPRFMALVEATPPPSAGGDAESGAAPSRPAALHGALALAAGLGAAFLARRRAA